MQTFDYFRKHYSVILITSLLGTYNHTVFANELFVGKFSSETKENFGPGKLGQIEVNIKRKDEKYVVTVFNLGEFKFEYLAVPCSSEKEAKSGYLQEHPPGETYALCHGSNGGVTFFYSQYGIKDPLARIYKYQGTENTREDKYFKAQYYGYIQWSIWGFRKVDTFQFAPNDSLILSTRETPEFVALCKTSGVEIIDKPKSPVHSIAYDWDPKRLKGRPPLHRIELDEDGRILVIGGFSKPNSLEAKKKSNFEFTETRSKNFYEAANLHGDVLAYLDVDNPTELNKAPVKRGAIKYRLTLSDQRTGAKLGTYTFVIDQLNGRACGVSVDNIISPDAFIYDVINQ
ncbi:MAG: hypothetical protein U1E13_11875 [Methylophilaceae bacterium]|nr:hypothetical protein [Methylophilaceae bacterium]